MKTVNFFFLTFFLMIFGGCIHENMPEASSLKEGDKIPEFTLVSNGETLSSNQMPGIKKIIVFFNTQCKDCREALPKIQKAYEADMLVNTPIAYYCISREECHEEVAKYWKDNSLTIPFYAQEDRRIFNLFASSGIPRVYIIDKNNIILKVYE